jgi:hypothetical protein
VIVYAPRTYKPEFAVSVPFKLIPYVPTKLLDFGEKEYNTESGANDYQLESNAG